MRIVKCFINNFGKLSDYSVDFDEKLTVIKEDNGFGKSTLCAFIKAMFYGFNQTRSKDLNENERAKYTPWQKGIFGGNIEFVCEKGNFKIERTFGEKAASDTFLLINLETGKKSEKFSENIGEELFGIDIKGFERCTCISENIGVEKIPISVSSRLSQMVDNTDDFNNFDSAFAALLKRSRQYKTTGNRGIIYDLEREKAETDNLIFEADKAFESIKNTDEMKQKAEKQRDAVAKELENTRSLIAENASIEVVKQKIKHYNSLVANAKVAKERFESLEQKYGGEMPDKSDLKGFSDVVEKIKTLTKEEGVYLRRKRIVHSVIHSMILIFGAVLFLLNFISVFLSVSGAIIIAVDLVFCAVSFTMTKRKEKQSKTELQELNTIADGFRDKYKIECIDYMEILEQIESDLGEYRIEKARFDDSFAAAKQYFKQENLKAVKHDIQSKPPDELKEKEKNLTGQYDAVSSEILKISAQEDKLRSVYEKRDELVYKKEKIEEKILVATENYNALLKGMELLSQAKENISSRYKNKIEKNFIEIVNFLSDGNLKGTTLSNDFDIMLCDNGFSRELISYSSGTKAVIKIALKLSLLESLFEKEKGFIILDDPFAFLDDKTFSKIAEKVKILSETTQIIYFTCVKSRTL